MHAYRHKALKIAIFITCFMSVVFLSWSIYTFYKPPIMANISTSLIISIDKSTTASQFVDILKQKNIIQSRRLFLSYIRLKGLANQLKAGVYEIKPGETALHLLNRVVAGDVLVRNFTIIAGTTQKKIAEDLQNASFLHYDPSIWLSIQDEYPNPEGLLLADTYQYRGGSNAKILLNQAHRNLINYLNTSWSNRSPKLPFKNPYELLIAASIIEKESAIPEERKLIAGVLVNRLKVGMPLQMDPTVIYALQTAYTGKLVHNDLSINSPYNSYRNRGLPPTPIATVGKEAIDAAAHPTESNYLYFVAKGDGTHQFSETYQQQIRAIDNYKHKDL